MLDTIARLKVLFGVGSRPIPVEAATPIEPVSPDDAGAATIEPAAAEPALDRAASFKRLVGPNNRVTAIDVGGAANLQPHWTKMTPICDFIVYEPNTESFDALVERQQESEDYKNFHYLKAGLAERPGQRSFYVTNVPTGSSLRAVNENGISTFNESSYFFPLKVETINVDSLASSLDAHGAGDIHIIKLDTQGTELEILRGVDEARMASLLAIELEVGLLDHYEGDDTALEDVMRFAREKGFQLFDLRCSRFAGSALRYGLEEMFAFFRSDLDQPPSGQRLNEVDAIFFRETRHFIRSGPDEASIRRFVALLCVYNFYMEAAAAIRLAAEEKLLEPISVEAILAEIKHLFDCEKTDLAAFAEHNPDQRTLFWGQYMWVGVPST